MRDYVCIVGLDDAQATEMMGLLDVPTMAHLILPRIMLRDGVLYAEMSNSARYAPISAMIFHGIFEHDLDFFVGLSLWGGTCLPNPRAMLDLRLKLPGVCLF